MIQAAMFQYLQEITEHKWPDPYRLVYASWSCAVISCHSNLYAYTCKSNKI